jgi:hypothetical protein
VVETARRCDMSARPFLNPAINVQALLTGLFPQEYIFVN